MKKSRTRCRMEYVFGHKTNMMGRLVVRCIEIVCVHCATTLKDLAYNFQRAADLVSLFVVHLKTAATLGGSLPGHPECGLYGA